jgi:small-conductance mechanosensitive channel
VEFLNFDYRETLISGLYPTLVILIFYLAACLFRWMFSGWGAKLAQKTRTNLDDEAIKLADNPLFYTIIFLGFYIAFDFISLSGKVDRFIKGLIFVAITIMMMVFVYRFINLLLKGYSRRIDARGESSLGQEFMPLMEKIVSIFVFAMGLIIILRHFNYDIFSLVTALGVGSLAIGLAAKETLSNMIAGFAIMIDRPFRPGDRIELSSGEIGDVTEIGLRSTKIKTFDHTIIVVPNAELVNYKVINQSYPDQLIKGKIELGIAYGSDIARAKEVMIEVARSVPHVLSDPPPAVYFINFGDSSLDLLMRFWVESYANLFETKDRINMLINERFKEEGIEIPFPIRTIYQGKEK